MTPEKIQAWLTAITVVLSFASLILGLLLKWVMSNKDTIVALVTAVRDIHKTVTKQADPATSSTTPAPLPAKLPITKLTP